MIMIENELLAWIPKTVAGFTVNPSRGFTSDNLRKFTSFSTRRYLGEET